MKKAICHYSFHRSWTDGNWDVNRLCAEVKKLDVEGIDFHARLIGDPDGAVDKISKALEIYGLDLAGFSLSTNFNLADPDEYRKMIEDTKRWLKVASELRAPVSRIFGGGIEDRTNNVLKNEATERVLRALSELVNTAEKYDIVLALENHGGLPCTGEEQLAMIEEIGSEFLKATVDVGNYLQGGQSGSEGTSIVASQCAYVHFKDFKKIADDSSPLGYQLEACTVGDGDVDLEKCMDVLRKVKYDGYIALEYEGLEAEEIGVPASIKYMNEIIAK